MQLPQPQPQPQLPCPWLLLFLLLLATVVSSSPLDPKQLKLLHSLNIKDPCNNHNSSSITITCDTASPYRHITSITFINCSSLSPPHHLPISLHSFTAVSSFLHHRRQLSGLFLARLINLKNLEISSTPISTSNHLYVILGNMRKLTSLTISNSNLSGKIPKSFHSNLLHIDLSNNSLKGSIHNSITHLSNLKSLNLSHNLLSGQIPKRIGNLILLKNLSLASNTFSGTIPNSLISISQLTHLDLSMNQLNGTVPSFLSEMKNLKHLNLSDNSFNGVLPFNESFIKNLQVFEIGRNSDLCYNESVISSRLKLGIAPSDKNGLVEKGDYDDYESDGENEEETKKEEHNGSRKTWFGIGMVLFCTVLLIIFLFCLAKRCGWIWFGLIVVLMMT